MHFKNVSFQLDKATKVLSHTPVDASTCMRHRVFITKAWLQKFLLPLWKSETTAAEVEWQCYEKSSNIISIYSSLALKWSQQSWKNWCTVGTCALPRKTLWRESLKFIYCSCLWYLYRKKNIHPLLTHQKNSSSNFFDDLTPNWLWNFMYYNSSKIISCLIFIFEDNLNTHS